MGPTYPFRGGISHYTTLLFRHLKQHFKTNMYAFKYQYPRVLFPGRTDRDTSSIPMQEEGALPILNSLNPFTWVHTAYRIISDRPDLVIFPWWVVFWAPSYLMIIFLVKLFSGAKILFICHNVREHESHVVKNLLTAWVLRRGDYFITHSHQEKLKLLLLLKKEKPVLEAHHPTFDVFAHNPLTKKEARRILDIKEKNVILFFGFVRPYKGLEFLVNAFPRIVAAVPDTRLIIAGEFWIDRQEILKPLEERNLKTRVSVLDRYIANEEIPALFRASDIVVLPYISITGSGVIPMSFGFHRPVVVTDIGSLSSVVKQGETGFLVPPENAEAIAETVTAFFLSGDREMMSENIRRDSPRFSWSLLVDQIKIFLRSPEQREKA